MIQRFASASAVASVLIALAAGVFCLISFPNPESRYLVTTVWCMLPLAWGLWAMLTPKSWLPQRLPLWGAILGLIVVLFANFVSDLSSLFQVEGFPVWLRGVGALLAVGIYYLVWFLVRMAYRALTAPSPTA
jgi:hypothetical protein